MIRTALAATAAVLIAACGGVQIKPDPVIPKALIEPLPADVGLIVASEMRNFKHDETRWGSNWQIDLGNGHLHLVQRVFKAAFRDVKEFPDLESARASSGLKALFEPRIEQYSFATARETGGRYYAVTVRYRINMYTPAGDLADSFTLTGYGNALAKGMSSGKPLEIASVGAMRDAAAKFLVQFPSQPAGLRLARNEAIIVEAKAAAGSAAADPAGIEAVPIEEGDEPDKLPAALPAPGAGSAAPDASSQTTPASPAAPQQPSTPPPEQQPATSDQPAPAAPADSPPASQPSPDPPQR